jgi:hypothetical protein
MTWFFSEWTTVLWALKLFTYYAGLSYVFEGLQGEKLTSPVVKHEFVDEGKRKGVPDAVVLDRLFAMGVFRFASHATKSF